MSVAVADSVTKDTLVEYSAGFNSIIISHPYQKLINTLTSIASL